MTIAPALPHQFKESLIAQLHLLFERSQAEMSLNSDFEYWQMCVEMGLSVKQSVDIYQIETMYEESL